MNTFLLTVLNARRVVFSGEVASCTAVTAFGCKGFESGHEAYLAVLAPGSQVTWSCPPTDGAHHFGAAVLWFRDNACTVVGTGP
ncbi:MAG: hypothetical protein WCG80_08895 [Spirochaetales bacterium]